jgi:UDP-sugar transporter A1/2/3
LFQTICSCLAGVYNEYLLKGEAANVNIFVQNVFMYIDSILCNVAVLLIQGHLIEAFDNAGPSIFMDPKVILIMFNNAAIGIVTSFFLKNLNSIVKTFASALELVFTAIFCWILFGITIYWNTALAIAIVSFAVILYSQNPVQNTKTLE